MDATAFRESVEADKATELDRLGSSKLLVAMTDADLAESTVLRVAAVSEYLARDTFAAWADDEADEDARAVFGAIADQEREHYDRVVDRLDDRPEPDAVGPMHAYLRQLDGTVERAAGIVGRGLVSTRSHVQLISFFVNEADEAGANLFRDLRGDTEEATQSALDLLDARCEDDEDWDRARAVAEYVVQVAYDDYADSLTELGVDPKAIC
ncbi:rubrerythrin family protein [Haloarchaeobius sp. HRN-SO-5]|uniref:rubrerythrin family protein n=1 Tax=Haloarchaeobius sp. HRN-SO-5 TaxID=3446118 RepID=UPI003EBADB67